MFAGFISRTCRVYGLVFSFSAAAEEDIDDLSVLVGVDASHRYIGRTYLLISGLGYSYPWLVLLQLYAN
jgi:hypothetical protein